MALALIVAAGSGERLGAGRPKAFVEAAGRPLLSWSLAALASVPAIEAVVVALPPGTAPGEAPAGAIGVPGGRTRSESVRHALAAAPAGGPVLVHDAARPLVSAALAERVLAALADPAVDAAVAAAPVADTIKRASAGQAGGLPEVVETVDRGALWAVQTPQVFRRQALERALAAPPEVLAQASDDAWLVERAGGRVVIVPAEAENLKVTTPVDLALAELLLARRAGQGQAISTTA